MHNGQSYRVKGFAPDGGIRLHTGRTLPPDYGHIDHGYVSTSHSAQGKTSDTVLIAQGVDSYPASGKGQIYVSASRGVRHIALFTDSLEGLRKAVSRDRGQMDALEVAEGQRKRELQRYRRDAYVSTLQKNKAYDGPGRKQAPAIVLGTKGAKCK